MSQENKLSKRIEAIAAKQSAEGITIGKLLDYMGEHAFGMLLLFLSMPVALPIPSIGYATPLGLIIMSLAVQMMLAKPEPYLPEKARNYLIKKSIADKMLSSVVWFLRKVEHLIYPRFSFATGKTWERLLGVVICILALIMALPFPLTNTIPAMVIFFIALGLLENDGLVCLLGFCVGTLLIMIYLGAFLVFIVYGVKGLHAVGNWLLEFVKNCWHYIA